MLGFCVLVILAEVATIIELIVKLDDDNEKDCYYLPNTTIAALEQGNQGSLPVYHQPTQQPDPIIIHGEDYVVTEYITPTAKPPHGSNVCEGKNPGIPDVDCIVDSMANVGPQAGANVTKGYQGLMNVDYEPLLVPFYQNGLCPVNVHWHLGCEHLSVGEYDEHGIGPVAEVHEGEEGNTNAVEDTQVANTGHRKLSGGDDEVRPGFKCYLYDEHDAAFTTPYNWQHCHDMVVGETYEVHWPHSAAGACGTPNQYQSPFADGVFCRDNVLTDTTTQVGVQAQVFVVVNDEAYYYPDLFRGMIIDGTYGVDIAKYTGSTTGTTRDNKICSQYNPITWQVDRQCHLISASSFDKMCADMTAQRDDMSADMHPHGARELVVDELAANNQHRRRLRRHAYD
eukprot:scaffold3048_cov192-Amphora_coffeaeformis.AAC.10